MLWNLLNSAATSVAGSDSEGTTAGCAGGYGIWIMVGVFAVIMFAMSFMSKRSQKKRQEEVIKEHQALRPGNKVKTIGGICGVVVEICPEDNTFVLETGTEKSGKSYMKFDKQAVYQTDAVAEKPAKAEKEAKGKKTEEKATEEVKEEKDEKEESKE